MGTPRELAGTTIAGSAAELVDHPLGEDGIVRGLASVLGDPDRASELRVAGLLRSRIFDWDRTAEQRLAFYRKVLGS